MKVRAGLMSAKDAAASLGVSRKTYYQWEEKALAAMLGNLEEKQAGRPACPTDEKSNALEMRVKELEEKLTVAEQTAEIRAVLRLMETGDAKKKPRQR